MIYLQEGNAFKDYVSQVCKTHGISKEEMFSKTKERRIVDARQMLFYLCVKRKIRIKHIENFMEEMGLPTPHSTIIHHHTAMLKKMRSDGDIRTVAKHIASCVD